MTACGIDLGYVCFNGKDRMGQRHPFFLDRLIERRASGHNIFD
jgi:hypothetical protein